MDGDAWPVTDPNVLPDRAGEPSSSLLARVQAQEQAAWNRLVHLYSPLVFRWGRRAGLQEADALDVGQEVFQAVWRTVHKFHRDRPGATFRGWLRTITGSKVADFYRRRQHQPPAPGGSNAETLAQQLPV